MNQYEFIQRLLVKFMSNADENQAFLAKQDFEKFLPKTIDYDYLYEKVVTEYKLKSMPDIAWLKQHYRNKVYKDFDAGLTWTALIKTDLGDYEFAIEMKYTEEQVRNAYKKKGWTFLKGNRQETLMRYGLA